MLFRRLAALLLLLSCAALADDKFLKAGPVRLTSDGNKWAEKTLRRLSLEEKIGQMLMLRAIVEFRNVESPEHRRMLDEMRRYHVGSYLLTVPSEAGFVFRNQPYEAAMLTNALQRESPLPLLFAADFERGLHMRFQAGTALPSAMAFGAAGNPAYVERFARVVAAESRAIGVHWNFFPVADVNSNPQNPIINTRAFGEDPAQVGRLSAAYVRAAIEGGMLTTAKHFPGHGDTATDSHLEFSVVSGDRARLEAVELPPFRDAIYAGVDAVMVAHVTVPALEPDPNRPASVSARIIRGVLQGEMGFQGLVVPDAMDMAALTGRFGNGRAAVEAVKAGNDMVLIPADPAAAYSALLAAVRAGEIPESQVDASVLKVLRAKAALGLYRARLVDIDEVARVLARPENATLGRDVAQAAITLVRDNGRVLPLKKGGTASPPAAYGQMEAPPEPVLAVLLLEDLRSATGRAFVSELRARVPGARIIWTDPRNAQAMTPEVVAAARRAETVIVAAYAIVSGGKFIIVDGKPVNTVALQEGPATLLRELLLAAAPKTVMVALGNPYLALSFPEVQTYMCTFSSEPLSETAAVRALFGEAAIRGRLPVSIPGIAPRGQGIDKPSVVGRKGGRAYVR